MIVIVVGMHRSGTSALAGMLHENNIIMGEPDTFYPHPGPENLKGFYENFMFRKLNDMLLRTRRYNVKSFRHDISEIQYLPNKRVKSRMSFVITVYNKKYKTWGFKDPRTCLTIKVWLKVINDPGNVKIINIVRDVNEIAVSMIKRGDQGGLRKFKKLAIAYQSNFEKGVKNHKFLKIDFKDLISETKSTVAGIEEYLGLSIPDTSFIDPSLVSKKWI